MKSATKAPTRMSRAITSHMASPDEVTPTIASAPLPTLAKAGPPESPSQVCDGDRPNPTSRSVVPTAPSSSAVAGNAAGIAPAGASPSRSASAMSSVSVLGSNPGWRRASAIGTATSPLPGVAPKCATGSASSACTQCAAVTSTRGAISVAVQTSVVPWRSATTSGSPLSSLPLVMAATRASIFVDGEHATKAAAAMTTAALPHLPRLAAKQRDDRRDVVAVVPLPLAAPAVVLRAAVVVAAIAADPAPAAAAIPTHAVARVARVRIRRAVAVQRLLRVELLDVDAERLGALLRRLVQRQRRRELAAGDAANAEGARQRRQLRDFGQLQHRVERVGVAFPDEAVGRDAVGVDRVLRARLRHERLGGVHLERAAHVAELVVLADGLDVNDRPAVVAGEIEVQIITAASRVEAQEIAGRVLVCAGQSLSRR